MIRLPNADWLTKISEAPAKNSLYSKRLLLVTCMSTFNHLLHFARFCAGSSPSQQKHTTKKFTDFSLFKTLPKPNSLWPKKHKGCREPIKLQTNS